MTKAFQLNQFIVNSLLLIIFAKEFLLFIFFFLDNRRAHNESIMNSFCWLSKDSDQIITIDNRNCFNNLLISDFVTLSFSPDNFISISSDINKANVNDYELVKKNSQDIEIDEQMKERAIKNYGVQDFLYNADLISNECDVKYLWEWLDCKFFFLIVD